MYLDESDATGSPRATIADGMPEERRLLLYDPQTSGGLLFTAAESIAPRVEQSFRRAEQPLWRIGRCAEGHGVHVS